jgi:hypothetical protein
MGGLAVEQQGEKRAIIGRGRRAGNRFDFRACLVKVRVNPVDVLGYAEDLSLMALFGRKALRM